MRDAPGSGLRIVFTTYQSGKVLAAASRSTGLAFDLDLLDEAHETVGQKGRAFSLEELRPVDRDGEAKHRTRARAATPVRENRGENRQASPKRRLPWTWQARRPTAAPGDRAS